jgi:hypothetical protein
MTRSKSPQSHQSNGTRGPSKEADNNNQLKEIELFDAKTGRYTDRPGFLGVAYLGRGTAYGLLIDTDHAGSDLDTAASLLKGEMAGKAYLLAGMIKKIKGDYPGAIRALTMASPLLTANEPARKQCEDLINSINAKTATTPTPSADKTSPSSALYLTVDGVEETVCTKDGHLTPKCKTKNGALPLVREVFRTLAPAATYYTNHATQLGDITGANDGFNGFRETVSNHGEKKWIFAQFEADINFERPNDFDHYNLQDVAIVIELNPTNLFILDTAAFENFQSAGDVLYRNGRGVLWYSAK